MPAERLRSQLATLHFPLDPPTRTRVQRSVCAYVDAMKAQQWPPERMLVGLKRIAAESGITSNALTARESRESRADLLMDIVAWSIARYYEAAERGPS